MRAIDLISIGLIAISIVILATSTGIFLLGENGQTVFNGKTLIYDNYTNGTLAGEDVVFAHNGETYSPKFQPTTMAYGINSAYVISDHSVKGSYGETENIYVSEDYIEGDYGTNLTYNDIDIIFIEEVIGQDGMTYQIYLIENSYYAIAEDGQATIIVDGNPLLLQSIGGKMKIGLGSQLTFDSEKLVKPMLVLFGMFVIGYIFVWKPKKVQI